MRAGMVMLSTLLVATAAQAAVLLQVGQPDNSCLEFGLADRNWQAWPDGLTLPVSFRAGKDATSKWPFIHPSSRDTWAGGQPHTFTVNFDLARRPEADQWLHLGVLAAWEPSELQILLNGQELWRKRLTAQGDTSLAYDPSMPGEASDLAVQVPSAALRTADNQLSITLRDGSWIIYDYLLLSDQQASPVMHSDLAELRQAALHGPLSEVQAVVFALRKPVGEHWYANFGYYAPDVSRKLYLPGSKLCLLTLRTGERQTLLDDPQGGLRDPVISADGQRVLFSWRRGDSDHYNLYEMEVSGGTPRQITTGPWDDIEPTYLPDGGIAFVSSRCQRWVNCWLTQVAVIYRCEKDGSGLRQLSGNIEHDNTPWPMPDGRLLYTRWEYVDRSQVHYHHLWTMSPDGSQQQVWYGNERPGDVYIDAKPVPNSERFVTVVSPGHGDTEHRGRLALITPKAGPDAPQALSILTATANFRDPWAVDEQTILAARDTDLALCLGRGKVASLYQLPPEEVAAGYWLHEPRPVFPRQLGAVIPNKVDLRQANGRFMLQDVHLGRNMEGVKRGEIKSLLVLESLPKPINFTGGMEPLSYGGTFTLERILGTVPVAPDGSAYFEAPALRSLVFVALDANQRSVKRMQSFATVQPGETLGCVGCHERRERTPSGSQAGLPTAMRRAPSIIEPEGGVPDVLDYPRDIQPVWDRHCMPCHSPTQRDGAISLSGHQGPVYTQSYYALTARDQLADGRNRPVSNYPPRALGSGASRLLDKLGEAHHGVAMSADERRLVRLWIDVGAPHPGTYAALGTGMIGGYAQNVLDRSDLDWPATKAGVEVVQRRCASCHTGARTLPASASDEIGGPPWEDMGPDDPRRVYSRHLLYDLTTPNESLLLLAPLAKGAGGSQRCGDPVFASTEDQDYEALLGSVQAAADQLQAIGRFNMPGFKPRDAWVREMRRYGIVTAQTTLPYDPYAIERRYWESLWWRPTG